MSDNRTPPLTEKELREIYNTFSKEKLINSLINKHMQIRTLQNEMFKSKTN